MQVNFGRTFIVGFEGTELDDKTAQKLQEINPAGVILYDTNIQEPSQVKQLILDLRNLLGDDLLVSVDQEGGKVERLRKVSSSLPSMQALGRASRKLGEDQGLPFAREPIVQYAQLLGLSLRELGFNMVYAPCADLATNPRNPIIGTRSLGANAEIVSEQIKIIIQELRRAGIIPCIKHFPGHGDSSKDSHLELPVINYGLQEYFRHLKPFIGGLSVGVESIMIAHLLVQLRSEEDIDAIAYDLTDISFNEIKELNLSIKKQDQELPASISERIIEEELRKVLGYQGAVISDEITMKALSNYGSYSEICQKMLHAGINLIIWNSNLDEALEASRELNALDGSERDQLVKKYHESLRYINALKSKINDVAIDFSVTELEEKMLEICRTSIAWRDRHYKDPEHSEGDEAIQIFIFKHPKLEPEVFAEVFKCKITQFSNWSDIEKPLSNMPALLFSFQTANNPEERKAIEELRTACPHLLVISTDQEDTEADVHLYGANRVHLRALIASMKSL